MPKKVAFVLGDQLFPPRLLKAQKPDAVFMSEDFELCQRYRFHKHKLIFFLSAMRTHAEELSSAGLKVTYHELEEIKRKDSYEKRLLSFIADEKASEVVSYQVEDTFLEQRLSTVFDKKKVKWTQIPSPGFLSTHEQFQDYLSGTKKPFMKTFYEEQRVRLGVLLDKKGGPEGGQWSFDTDNRKKLPKSLEPPELPSFQSSELINDVKALVEKHFKSHPGEVEDYWLPVDRKSAKKRLKHFLGSCLTNFGAYQDAVTNRSDFVFHSVLSPFINSGLLTPAEVLSELEKARTKTDYPMNSVEGFVRQLIGWREFVRGVYRNYSSELYESNFFGHKAKLASSWYEGTTGIDPLDYAIKKSLKYGYAHHIERLMVLSNLMLLCRVDPQEVYKWFMEMFIDSGDWVMAANVFDMGQFSTGGIFATKPYICGSNYLLKMGDFKKGDWCEIVDGLYWSFIEDHREFFASQYRLSMMVRTLDKMKSERKNSIFTLAEEFRARHCPRD